MSIPLPPFSGDRPTCAKCGGHEARTTWMAEARLCACRTPTGTGERMCRDCPRCGYHWDEAVAVRADAVPEGEWVPLGQQFDVRVYASSVLVTHSRSGLRKVLNCAYPAAADAAVTPLLVFQQLLDEVDDWGRKPIEASCSPATEVTVPNNLEQQ